MQFDSMDIPTDWGSLMVACMRGLGARELEYPWRFVRTELQYNTDVYGVGKKVSTRR